VCDVTASAHVKRLLRISEAYEVVLPDDPQAAAEIVQNAKAGADDQDDDEPQPAPATNPIASMDKMTLVEYVTTNNLDIKLNLATPLATLRKQVLKALAEKEEAAKKQRELAILIAERDDAQGPVRGRNG
jgi:hypothetical protein